MPPQPIPLPAPLTPPLPGAAQLQRAAALRHLAYGLQSLRITDLHRWAGPDTWVGPVAQRCHDELLFRSRLLAIEVEALLATARRLEQVVVP